MPVPTALTTDRIIRIFAFVLIVGLLIFLAFRPPFHSTTPNNCPIDGQPANWSKQEGNTCEYGHFSVIEKKAHTWSAACQ